MASQQFSIRERWENILENLEKCLPLRKEDVIIQAAGEYIPIGNWCPHCMFKKKRNALV